MIGLSKPLSRWLHYARPMTPIMFGETWSENPATGPHKCHEVYIDALLADKHVVRYRELRSLRTSNIDGDEFLIQADKYFEMLDIEEHWMGIDT